MFTATAVLAAAAAAAAAADLATATVVDSATHVVALPVGVAVAAAAVAATAAAGRAPRGGPPPVAAALLPHTPAAPARRAVDAPPPPTVRALASWALAGRYTYAGTAKYAASAAWRVCPASLTIRPYAAVQLSRDASGGLWLPPPTMRWNDTAACTAVPPADRSLFVIGAAAVFGGGNAAGRGGAYPALTAAIAAAGAGAVGATLHAQGHDFTIVHAAADVACGRSGRLPAGSLAFVLRDEVGSFLIGTTPIPPRHKALLLFVAPRDGRAAAGGRCLLSTAVFTAGGQLLAADTPPPPADGEAPPGFAAARVTAVRAAACL
ncbi:hypothetical protein BU14_0615s0004 [Porphyra umbilicalis]|uniref:Uncharacterized protein n=1 Tax=Porphyra umbilicalis TaxID=2786 RepID=A0A1X6NR11_PORUM|nr:hypothetical protein BU14_0615s0004 [Porphyra umbilicalis]|eukprot:OSX71015.1 hypothetical protein BU14_0615s0004 [Porphyra umbilicalis]